MRSSRLYAALVWGIILLVPAHAWMHGSSWPNPVGTNWSTLGIVADGVTDNTAALNALPTGTTIIGDCPAGGTINYSGQWIWQSSLTIYQRQGCWLKCLYTNANLNNSCITQTDLTTPIANVFYWGLSIEKPDLTYLNRMAMLWVDHLTLRYFNISTYKQAFYIRGSDQEFGWCTSSNPLPAVGSDFIRHFGNVPLQTTTAGRPANVWIHNCSGICGDACYQIGQPFAISNWGNTNTDGVLIENSSGTSLHSSMLLIGQPGVSDPGANNFYIQNVIARNLSGSGAQSGVRIAQTVGNAQAFSNITLQNITLDGTINTTSPDGPFNLNSSASTSAINNVTLDTVTAVNAFERDIVVDGVYNGVTIKNSTLPAPRTGSLRTVYIGQNVNNVTINNNTIGSNAASAIGVGVGVDATAFTQTATINNNILSGVSNNRAGIELDAVDSASATGNVVTQVGGATTAHGASLTIAGATHGTTNSTVTANNFSGVSGTTQVVCASGQGNSVTSNTGATGCAP